MEPAPSDPEQPALGFAIAAAVCSGLVVSGLAASRWFPDAAGAVIVSFWPSSGLLAVGAVAMGLQNWREARRAGLRPDARAVFALGLAATTLAADLAPCGLGLLAALFAPMGS